jgi:YacP-like NYN domain
VPTSRDPLATTDRLIVDGSNFLPALAALAGRGDRVPQAALIGRLRAAIPASTRIELVFDGAPEQGLRGERIASGLLVRHAGRRSADDVILGLVDQARAVAGMSGVAGLLIVTDDRALRSAVQAIGARTAGTEWLLGRLDRPRLSAPSVGNRRSPATTPITPRDDDSERTPWKPGRGATTKRGNPRRRRPSSGSMPS